MTQIVKCDILLEALINRFPLNLLHVSPFPHCSYAEQNWLVLMRDVLYTLASF